MYVQELIIAWWVISVQCDDREPVFVLLYCGYNGLLLNGVFCCTYGITLLCYSMALHWWHLLWWWICQKHLLYIHKCWRHGKLRPKWA